MFNEITQSEVTCVSRYFQSKFGSYTFLNKPHMSINNVNKM